MYCILERANWEISSNRGGAFCELNKEFGLRAIILPSEEDEGGSRYPMLGARLSTSKLNNFQEKRRVLQRGWFWLVSAAISTLVDGLLPRNTHHDIISLMKVLSVAAFVNVVNVDLSADK